jgi:hypothetical protein
MAWRGQIYSVLGSDGGGRRVKVSALRGSREKCGPMLGILSAYQEKKIYNKYPLSFAKP